MRKLLTLIIASSFLLVLVSKNAKATGPSLLFDPDMVQVRNGDTFSVAIKINTAGNLVAGAGAKIKFDPAHLSVVAITPGTIFKSYPGQSFDNQLGTVTISGIIDNLSNQFSGEDVFATVEFQGKADGPTTVNFDFTPGSTTDSNIAVTYGNGDILAEVNTLTVRVKTERAKQILQADANKDKKVDGVDYVIWLTHYGITTKQTWREGDYTRNYKVDDDDYSVWLNEFLLSL